MVTRQPTPSGRMTRQAVAALFREQIVSGALLSGDRLPPRETLARELAASYVTIQRGLTQLGDEGFIVSRHGDGTYVAENLPHHCHYGLVLTKAPEQLREAGQARFHYTMRLEAERFNNNHSTRRIYTWHDSLQKPEREEYHDLVRTLQERRLAGLIFLDYPLPRFGDSPLMRLPNVGRVTPAPGTLQPGLERVCLSHQAFLVKAMRLLAERGRKRLAVLTTRLPYPDLRDDYPQVVAATAAQAGLVTKPQWTIPQHPRLPEGVTATMRLLFDLPRDEWPDALIIADDHLVEAAMTGLYEAGVDTCRDLTVIGYSNFPDRPPSMLPIVRLGLDCRDLLARLIRSIDRQTGGGQTNDIEWVDPITESEFESRYPG